MNLGYLRDNQDLGYLRDNQDTRSKETNNITSIHSTAILD